MAEDTRGRRRSLRRAIAIDCALRSERWERAVHLRASDVSVGGMWIETPVAVAPGEELIVSFQPPSASETVWAAAKVVRVGSSREGADARPGMALAFTYLSERHVRVLARALQGHPPRLPASAERTDGAGAS